MYKKLMVTAFVMMLLQGVTFASMYATGGTEVYISGDDTVAHIFTENGTFVLKEEKLVCNKRETKRVNRSCGLQFQGNE